MTVAISGTNSNCCDFIPTCVQEFFQRIYELAMQAFACIRDFFCCRKSTDLSPTRVDNPRAEPDAEANYHDRIMSSLQFGYPRGVNLGSGATYLGRSRGLNLLPAPFIGHYNNGGYYPTDQRFVVRLPGNQLAAFPQAIQDRFRDVPLAYREVYFVIYDDRALSNAGETMRNLCFHPVAYPQVNAGENKNFTSSMGIFETDGINPAQAPRSIAVDAFSNQGISIHPARGGMAMSPDNAKFQVDLSQSYSSFWSAATLPDGKMVASLNLIAHNDNSVNEINAKLRESGNINQFIELLSSTSLSDGLKEKIRNLFQFHRSTQ